MALMAEGKDKLSALSDDILSHHILTRLPLKDAIASSLLSSRWRWLWIHLPRLNFSHEFYISLRNKAKINSIMKKLVLINPGELESFELHIPDHYTQADNRVFGTHPGARGFRMHSDNRGLFTQADNGGLVFFRKMYGCISYAALRKVKQLTLISLNSRSGCVPSSVFSCHCLTSLILNNLDAKCNPTNFGGFPCLKTCSFTSIELRDAILEHLLAGSPHLQSLTLSCCVGLINLTVQCPFLNDLSIEIGRKEYDIFRSKDLVYVPNIVKLNCPQLVNLKLERSRSWEDKLKLLEKMVVEINLPACRGLSTNLVCVKDILDRFPNLEDLSMDAQCFLDFQKSFFGRSFRSQKMFESIQTPALLEKKLRRVQVITSEFGEKELNLLGYILQNCPLLETVTLSPPSHLTKSSLDLIFVNKLLGLQRSSGKARIFITQVK